MKERIQKFRETCNLKHICKNESDKFYSDHDVSYFDSKALAKRTVLDKILKDKACEIARNPKYDE